ncbi:hypothetical protein ACLOJK_022351 [Asimina triloba]
MRIDLGGWATDAAGHGLSSLAVHAFKVKLPWRFRTVMGRWPPMDAADSCCHLLEADGVRRDLDEDDVAMVDLAPDLGKMVAVSSCRSSDLSRRPLPSVMVGLDLPVGYSSAMGSMGGLWRRWSTGFGAPVVHRSGCTCSV